MQKFNICIHHIAYTKKWQNKEKVETKIFLDFPKLIIFKYFFNLAYRHMAKCKQNLLL